MDRARIAVVLLSLVASIGCAASPSPSVGAAQVPAQSLSFDDPTGDVASGSFRGQADLSYLDIVKVGVWVRDGVLRAVVHTAGGSEGREYQVSGKMRDGVPVVLQVKTRRVELTVDGDRKCGEQVRSRRLEDRVLLVAPVRCLPSGRQLRAVSAYAGEDDRVEWAEDFAGPAGQLRVR